LDPATLTTPEMRIAAAAEDMEQVEAAPQEVVAPPADTPVADVPPANLPPAAPSANDATANETPAASIAREAFDTAPLGSSYDEIAQRFGREGVAALTMDDASGVQTRHYVWKWGRADGGTSRISMRFVNDRLTQKSWLD
jgi:hypothetical protein